MAEAIPGIPGSLDRSVRSDKSDALRADSGSKPSCSRGWRCAGYFGNPRLKAASCQSRTTGGRWDRYFATRSMTPLDAARNPLAPPMMRGPNTVSLERFSKACDTDAHTGKLPRRRIAASVRFPMAPTPFHPSARRDSQHGCVRRRRNLSDAPVVRRVSGGFMGRAEGHPAGIAARRWPGLPRDLRSRARNRCRSRAVAAPGDGERAPTAL